MKSFEFYFKKVVRNIGNYAQLDSHKLDRTIFIAGSGRSGTTWLQEIVNYDSSYRIIFEPFFVSNVPLVKDWRYRQYFRPESNNPKQIQIAEKILSGRYTNRAVNSNNYRLVSHKRIVKDILSHFQLGWLHHHFPQVPIVLILRHPCAVMNSYLHLDYVSGLNTLLTQKELVSDFLAPMMGQIQAAKTELEELTTRWCLENLFPLQQFSSGEILVTFYEDLCLHPEHEINRIFDYLNVKSSKNAVELSKRPGSQSKPYSAVTTGKDRVSVWKEHLASKQIDQILDTVALFGLDKIYQDDVEPLVGADQVLDTFSFNPEMEC